LTKTLCLEKGWLFFNLFHQQLIKPMIVAQTAAPTAGINGMMKRSKYFTFK
jgi:hypothetical protein